MKNAKRLLACLVCAVLICSSVSAFAQEEKVFRGYDVSDAAITAGTYAKIYDIYINGKPTGKEVRVGYASKVEWKHAFYEKAYPHAGYQRLYLDDNYTSVIVATGAMAPWAQEYRDDMWELKYPYKIFQHLYTNIENNGFVKVYPTNYADWDVVYNYSGRNAAVSQEYKYFGFGQYRVTGPNQIERAYGYMLNWVQPQDISQIPFLNAANLSLIDPDDGTYVYSDYDIAVAIKRYNSEYLTGPDFVKGGTQTIDTYSNYVHYFPSKPAYYYNDIIKPSEQFVSIDWTYPTYELAERYKYYQVLIIDGVVMDGRRLSDGSYLPYIYRYIDEPSEFSFGIATPIVEWKHEGFEAAWPFKGYDVKYVDGIKTNVTRYNGFMYGDFVPNVTWREEGCELVYPFKGYDRQYIDGVATAVTQYNGKFGKLIGEATYNSLSGKYEYIVWYEGFGRFTYATIDFPGELYTNANVYVEQDYNERELLEATARKKP